MKKLLVTLLVCVSLFTLCGCGNNGNYSKIKKLVEDNKISFEVKNEDNWTEEVSIVSYGATGVIMTYDSSVNFYGIVITQKLYIEWNKSDSYISFSYIQDGNTKSYDYEKTSVLKQYIKDGKVSSIEGSTDSEEVEYVNKLLNYVDEYLKTNYGYGIAD